MELMIHTTGFGQMFGVPNIVVDQYLKLATPSQLKVLLYMLRHNNQSLRTQEIASALSISGELVEEALLFWEQTDLLQDATPQSPPQETSSKEVLQPESSIPDIEISEQSTEKVPHAVALSHSKSGELSPIEIAAALEKSEDLKMLFCMAEQQMGRPLRHIEQKALIWMHDYNNIGSDIILTVLLYCKSIDKCSVSYAESLIIAWWNEGIQTLPQVTTAINEMDRRQSFTGKIQRAFEMQRKPTPKQQELIDAWQKQEIPMELITYAYEKTLESTGKLSFPYLNSILTRWMETGYRTRIDVDTKDQPSTRPQKSAAKKTERIPESDNAEAYRSFIYNIDE